MQVLDSSGQTRWTGDEAGLPEFLARFSAGNSGTARLAGTAMGSCTHNEVTELAEQLGFISRRGTPKGFVTTLPPGSLIDESVAQFNRGHMARLRANRVDFPLVFATDDAEMGALVSAYEQQGRMFRFDERDPSLRLSYAADPNLFAWLRHTRADPSRLPYTIISPQPIFRRFQSGELSLDRARQYHVSDVHTLCPADRAAEVFRDIVGHAAKAMEFWFGDDYCQIVDAVTGTEFDCAETYEALSKSVPGVTIVRHLAARSRYYAIKGGLYVDAGFGTVMLFNFQLDDTNPGRFDIRLDDDGPMAVIHSTLAAGVPKLLPITLGRGLAGVGPRALPPELARHQLVLVPVREHHRSGADELAATLRTSGLRVTVDAHLNRSLGHRLAALRSAWQPLFAVVGDRELAGEPLTLDGPQADDRPTLSGYLAANRERLQRCAPTVESDWTDPPFHALAKTRKDGYSG
ncbi:His/Gly/Thr/Pro-type tRNA ligase C-terminal domain-containing protein [Micromonospora sp. DT53]